VRIDWHEPCWARGMAVVNEPRVLVSLMAVLGLSGCERGAPISQVHSVVVRAETAGRQPLADVEIWRKGRAVGKTRATGSLTLQLEGSEGQRFELEARCPATYVPERQPLSVTLRRLVEASKSPTYRVDCQPSTRTTVVAVRATNGPDLPVMYLGREVARTDSSGVAHVALTLRPGERYELRLDTTGKPLTPKDPRAVFVVGSEDELVFFEQRFQSRKVGGGRARPRLPTAF
jgi:hypothetical protein